MGVQVLLLCVVINMGIINATLWAIARAIRESRR